MSASPVRTSSPAAARVHRVVEVARLALKKPVSRCRNLVRMSAKGRTLPLDLGFTNGRNRRISLVAGRPGEGPLTEPIAATQPRRQEPLFMPRNGRCRREGATARSGGELPFPISSACDAHGLIADPHASVARIAAKRRVAVITPAFSLAATRLPLGHINLSGCSTATPDRKPILK